MWSLTASISRFLLPVIPAIRAQNAAPSENGPGGKNLNSHELTIVSPCCRLVCCLCWWRRLLADMIPCSIAGTTPFVHPQHTICTAMHVEETAGGPKVLIELDIFNVWHVSATLGFLVATHSQPHVELFACTARVQLSSLLEARCRLPILAG